MSAVLHRDSLSSCHSGAPVLQSVHAEGSVRGLLFELAVEQRYRNLEDVTVEAVYTFPVPWNAVLLGVECVLGEKVLQGTVVAKADGERVYEAALEAGDAAVMVERAGDGMYTVNVGNLLPQEEAIVRFRYAQLLSFAQGQVRLTVPTVIAPRYGNPRGAGLQPHQAPTTDLRADYPFTLAITLHGELAGAALSSPSHGVSVRSAAGTVTVAVGSGARLDRDFVLLAGGLAGKSLSTLGRDGDGYVALASFCPHDGGLHATAPLSLKILVDCSGSMNGDRIAAARNALHEVLSHLEPADSFSFSRFGSDVAHLSASLLAATPRAIRKASEWVGATQADMGGTELREALLSTFALAQPFDADILLVTDGDVWDVDKLVASARTAGQRIFAVGIGSAPASSLLHALSQHTGGACELAASDLEVPGAILRSFRRMRQAPVRDVGVEWDGATTWRTSPGRVVLSSETVHHFAGFAERAPTGAALTWIEGAGGAERLEMPIDPAIAEGSTLARVAAAMRMNDLAPPERHALALQHGLVGATTNLVLVHQREQADKPAGMPVLRTVAHAMPAGAAGVGVLRASNSFCSGMRQPAVWRREDTAAMVQSGAARYDLPAFLRKEPDSPWLYRDVLRRFADTLAPAALRGDAAGDAPTSIDAIAAGLPAHLVDALRGLVDAGFPESEVVRALVRAVAAEFRKQGIARRMLHGLRRLGARPGSTTLDLERRVTALVHAAMDARRPGVENYDIPAFLRKQAD